MTCIAIEWCPVNLSGADFVVTRDALGPDHIDVVKLFHCPQELDFTRPCCLIRLITKRTVTSWYRKNKYPLRLSLKAFADINIVLRIWKRCDDDHIFLCCT